MTPDLSIVIPAFNEEPRLGRTLSVVLGYLREQLFASEVIVVDDGSSDGTARTARESFRSAGGEVGTLLIQSPQNLGKGHAVRTGLLRASAPIAIFSDADLSAPITEAPRLVAPIRMGQYDIVFGSRALDRTLIGVHEPWRREQGGRVFNLIVRVATRLPFWDTQCGFKAFRMSVCRPIIQAAVLDRFCFDVELLYLARAAGLRLLERPVRWDHNNEGSKVDPWRDGRRALFEIQRIRRLAKSGFYETAILSARRALEAEAAAGNLVIPDHLSHLSDMPNDLAVAGRRI